MQITRTHSENLDFVQLVKELDAYLTICDGDEHDFYDQYNHIELLPNVVVVYLNGEAIGCGAFKEYAKGVAEIKRMYVHPKGRRKGIAATILKGIESWALEKGYQSCILETGKRQLEAVEFYPTQGYAITDNFEPYVGMENSVCFKKELV